MARKSSVRSFFDTLGEVETPSTVSSTFHSTLQSTLPSPPPPVVDDPASKKFVDPLARFDPGVYIAVQFKKLPKIPFSTVVSEIVTCTDRILDPLKQYCL